MPDVRPRDHRDRRDHDPAGLRRPDHRRPAPARRAGWRCRSSTTSSPSRPCRPCRRGAAQMRDFRPDTIIALGGGSPMDAAKVMWLLYEHPEVDFADMQGEVLRRPQARLHLPRRWASMAQLVCIPTTSGTGAEVTPFAVITDPTDRQEVPAGRLRADPDGGDRRPGADRADARRRSPRTRGFDALTHATEAYVSVYANDFTDGLALHAIRLIFENLETSVNGDARPTRTPGAGEDAQRRHDRRAWRSATPSSASCTPWPTSSGATFHLVHGRTNATLLPHVIRYNGTVPTKLTELAQVRALRRPRALPGDRPACSGLPAATPAEGVESYAAGGRGAARRGAASRRRSRRRASTRTRSSARSTSWRWAPTRTSAHRPTRGCRCWPT